MFNKANARTKKKLLKAIAHLEHPHLIENFERMDFVRLPNQLGSTNCGRNYWASHCGDVTVIIWERGNDAAEWVVQFQVW